MEANAKFVKYEWGFSSLTMKHVHSNGGLNHFTSIYKFFYVVDKASV